MLNNLDYTIAVLDSGIGGISVLRQLIKNGGNYIYFADNAFMPYGKRSNSELSARLDSIIKKLKDDYNVNKIIIACNTASTILHDKYEDVITMKFIPDKTYIATKLSKKNLQGYSVIEDTTLANLIEKYIFDRRRLEKIIKTHIIKHKLNELKELVLGCTHYELVKDIFEKYCPNTHIINNSNFVIDNIKLNKSDTLNIQYITSLKSNSYVEMLERLVKEV